MAIPTSGDIQFQDLLNEFTGGRSETTATIDSGILGVYKMTGITGMESAYIIQFQSDTTGHSKIYPGMIVDENDPYFPNMIVTSWSDNHSIILEGTPDPSWTNRFGQVNSGRYSITFVAKHTSQFTRKVLTTGTLTRSFGVIPDLPANANVPLKDDVDDSDDINFSNFRGASYGFSASYTGRQVYTGEPLSNYTSYFGGSVPQNSTYYTRIIAEAYHVSFTVPSTNADWRVDVDSGRYRVGGRYRWDSGLYDTDYWYTYMKNVGWVLLDDDTGAIVHKSVDPREQKGADALIAEPEDKTNLPLEAGKTYRIGYTADFYAQSGIGGDGFLFETPSRPVFTIRNTSRG